MEESRVESYSRDHIKIVVGKVLQSLGWNSITSTPLEILTEVLVNYLRQITQSTVRYACKFGQTNCNLHHLGLTFKDFHISVSDLREYVRYVNFVPPPEIVPKYPIPREDNLNFLKPGSKEVLARPVHIHEHLPPMNPVLEGNENEGENGIKVEPNNENAEDVFKKPAILPPQRASVRKVPSRTRTPREINSVMMTSSGFISPAREGIVAKRGVTPREALEPLVAPPVTPPVVEEIKSQPKVVRKVEKSKKERVVKPAPLKKTLDDKIKKTQNVKCVLKNKPKPAQQNAVMNSLSLNCDLKISPIPSNVSRKMQQNKLNKALAAARLKTEKLNTTITPIIMKPTATASPPVPPRVDIVDKLFTEPDKKKVNIFKKITNVKNEKDVKAKKDDFRGSRESSPDLIIDEPDEFVQKLSNLPSDVTIEPINPPLARSSPKETEHPYYDDDSEPGISSTPKTPEMISPQSPPLKERQRKRKEGKRMKKILKHQSPTRLDSESIDIDMDRPKTPEAQVLSKMDNKMDLPLPFMGSMPFPFLTGFAGPGLIPANPLFSPFPLGLPNFGQKPYLPQLNPQMSLSPNVSIKLNESEKSQVSEKPTTSKEVEVFSSTSKPEKKLKEHKKDKKDKIKKRNKKDKMKNKAEKKKLREEKKEKTKKEKKEKRKDKEFNKEDAPGVKITLRIKSPSPRPETPETTRKLNIKPILKKDDEMDVEEEEEEEEERKRETSPALAKISALVTGPPKPKSNPSVTNQSANESKEETKPAPIRTGPGPGRPRIHPIKPKATTKPTKKRRAPVKRDAEGNEVWICPACGRQDDGSPMIGCDGGCDAWYHWVCVGIQVPPDDNENWYCRHCLLKKNEDLQSDRKKKRKKKERKEY